MCASSSELLGARPAPPADEAMHAPIRGSSQLLFGRVISLSVMCAVQVLALRYLPRADYGAWTYALSILTLLQSVAALGLDRSLTRFVAIYRERGDDARLRGTVLLLLAVVCASGTLLVLLLELIPAPIARVTGLQPEVMRLLRIAIVLVPLEAFDLFFTGLFACLGQATTILLRRHVLAPALKLTVVIGLVAMRADVTFLAYGYVGASLAGMLLYTPLLRRSMHELGLAPRQWRTRGVKVPARELLAFTLPLVTADLAGAIISGAGPLVLGHYASLDRVAVFAAAVPLAVLNQTVARNFTVLYTPTVARLFARGDREGINHVYWRTATWVAVLTFPVFAVTFSAAGALLHLLYGSRYADAAPLLSILALGEYVNVAFGLNGMTLRLLDKARLSVGVNVATAAAALAANALLVPRYGAFGAAIATGGTGVLHCVLKQAALALATDVRAFELRLWSFYGAIALCAAAVVVGQSMFAASAIVPLALAALASLLLVMTSRRALMVTEAFPEVRRVPVLGALFSQETSL